LNRVAIVGYGNTKFSSNDEKIDSLLLSCTKSLFDHTKNITQKDIDAVIVSTNNNSKYLSAVLSELAGIKPKISHTIENLCNSGTNSIVSAYSYVKSGLADIVLVAGAERFDSPGQIFEWDISRGEFNHPIYWASLFTKSHTRKYGTTKEDLAKISVKNHNNAKNNPDAYSNKTYSVDDVMNSKKLTEDLRLLDCSKSCTGSSAVLLVSESIAKKFTDTPIWIKGIGQKTLSAGFLKNDDFSQMNSTIDAVLMAFNMAKLNSDDVDVAEIHDAFTICEIMALEDLGFTKKGRGSLFTNELFSTESKKINPRGGLIGSGHPLGATGIAQVIEIVQQLENNADKRQIKNAKIGMVHNMSAAATSSTVLLLAND